MKRSLSCSISILALAGAAHAGGGDVYGLTMTGNPGPETSARHTFGGPPEAISGIVDIRPGATVSGELEAGGDLLLFEMRGPDGAPIFADLADPSDNEVLVFSDVALPGPIPDLDRESARVQMSYPVGPDRELARVATLPVGPGEFFVQHDLGTNFLPPLVFGPRVSVTLIIHGSGWESAGSVARRMRFTVEISAESNGLAFCSGDGSGTACPCGNTASAIGGCLNSSGLGARLSMSGVPSQSADTMQFHLVNGVPSSFAVLVSASAPLAGGNGIIGIPPTDGLRCVGAGMFRHGVRALNLNGGTETPWGNNGGLVAETALPVGFMRHYQVFIRELPTAGCGSSINTSNAVAIVIEP